MFTRFRSLPLKATAAVLGAAMTMSFAAPAVAQNKGKKEEKAKSDDVPVSRGFSASAKKMIDAHGKKDAAALETAIAEGQGKTETDGDRYWLAYYQVQLAALKNDAAGQRPGIETMLDSGLVPAANVPNYAFVAGRLAYSAQDYPKAIQRLEQAKAGGISDPTLYLFLMDSQLKGGHLDQGLATAKLGIEAARAAGQRPSDELYVRPIQGLQAADRDGEVLDMMTLRLRDYGVAQVWRQTLFMAIQETRGNDSFTLDALRLMRAAKAMSQITEYEEYAKLAANAALPGEAVAVIAEGRASKAIPTPYPGLDTVFTAQTERKGDEEATLTAYAARPETRARATVAGATADTLAGYGRYADAIPLYQAALSTGGDKDLWTYRLGVAQAMSGDTAGAKASFAQVTGPRKRLASLWTTKIDSTPSASTGG